MTFPATAHDNPNPQPAMEKVEVLTSPPVAESPTTNGQTGSPHHGPTNSPPSHPHQQPNLPRRQRSRPPLLKFVVLGVCASLLLGVGLVVASATGLVRLWNSSARTDLILHPVRYEHLQLTITERGQLEAADNSDIVCRVKAKTQASTVASTIRC